MHSLQDLAENLRNLPLKGRVVGVHSKPSCIGDIAPSPVSQAEAARGMKPIFKTIINAFLEAMGPNGTLFMPAHSNNHMGNPQYAGDDRYYHPAKSPSNVGSLTQSFVFDDRAVRSDHPTHSVAAIGPEARYLAQGHGPNAEPVGIHNAFAKAAGLDGIILFIGDVLKSNTTFHAYETLFLPAMAHDYEIEAAADTENGGQTFKLTWHPHGHRDFYAESKRPTRAIKALRESGLLQRGKLGQADIFYYDAKETARYFAEKVYPVEPDILYCAPLQNCAECNAATARLKTLYADSKGAWDPVKIRSGMDPRFLALLKPGRQCVNY